MLFPYRVKNPITHIPFATIAIIIANVVVYTLTTDNYLVLREDVAARYAFDWGAAPVWTLFTAIFLHGGPWHLAGNMYFLWIFGPCVEDRLRPLLFLAVYIGTGFIGGLSEAGIDILYLGEAPSGLGASGSIMGVLGAYWFMFSWSPVCVFYWFTWLWYGVTEVAAILFVWLYVLLDVVYGVYYRATGVTGGVGHFAHVGGAVAGALFCLALRAKRDPAALAEVKAFQAEAGDLSRVPLGALCVMSEHDPQNPDLIRAMTGPAIRQKKRHVIDRAMARGGISFIGTDPELVVWYLADFGGEASIFKPVHLLSLARSTQRAGDHARALKLYQSIVRAFPKAPSVEMALFKMAECYWKAHRDAPKAKRCIAEMGKRFPYGSMTPHGRALLREMARGGKA